MENTMPEDLPQGRGSVVANSERIPLTTPTERRSSQNTPYYVNFTSTLALSSRQLTIRLRTDRQTCARLFQKIDR